MKNLIIIIVLALLGAGGAYGYIKWSESQRQSSTTTGNPLPAGKTADAAEESHADLAAEGAGAVLCAKHRIPESVDAFCHPELVEKLGHCKGHDVAEAFCTRCSPSLIPAFKAENDWCAEHSVPESQCKLCKGGSDSETSASAGGEGVVLCAKHRIPESADAFCHPELVEKLGFCKEHDVAEAFCTRCNASLIPAFKAENDWCAEHSVPESQCKLCKGGA